MRLGIGALAMTCSTSTRELTGGQTARGDRIFVDSNGGPYPMPIRINGESPEALRHFDPKTQLFVFRSQKYDIGALVEAVRDVLSRANESEQAIMETMKGEAIKEEIRRNDA